MEVPERLALIGGSILLASTLIFTLKSQASNILPKIAHPISSIYDHAGDAQRSSDFNNNFKEAQRQGLYTGTWGSSKYYIDKNNDMHIGAGQLQGQLQNTISYKELNTITRISINQPVQFPQDSSFLFAGAWNVTGYDGLDQVDTSQVVNTYFMFFNNHTLQSLDLSSWNTSKVYDIHSMFAEDDGLKNIKVANWNTSNIKWMGYAFYDTPSLHDIDLSGWHTRSDAITAHMFVNGQNNNSSLKYINISNFNLASTNSSDDSMFGGGNIPQEESKAPTNPNMSRLDLGQYTRLKDNANLLNGYWKNGQLTLSSQQLMDDNSHPGTWIKQ